MRVPLWARLLMAATGAGVAIVTLEWQMRRREGAVLAAARPTDALAPVVVAGDEPIQDLGFWADRVVLLAGAAVAPATIEIQLLADGSHRLRRPPPLPSVPGRQRWPTVGIELPRQHLSALDPTQRAGLLELLAALLPERPVSAASVQLRGVQGNAADLAALLRWVR